MKDRFPLLLKPFIYVYMCSVFLESQDIHVVSRRVSRRVRVKHIQRVKVAKNVFPSFLHTTDWSRVLQIMCFQENTDLCVVVGKKWGGNDVCQLSSHRRLNANLYGYVHMCAQYYYGQVPIDLVLNFSGHHILSLLSHQSGY